MGLTPLDIQNKEFGRSFRGYNEAEVDEFLDRIVREFDALTKDNAALREQVESLSAKVEQFRRLEDTLHNTLVVAQQAADEVKASARKEADVIL
ncbi:MAG TPA: DivIVA domain-containing protein, partial [Bacillota bacterium]